MANWLANFLVSATLLSLVSVISRSGVFILHAAPTVLAVVFFWTRVPKTAGRSLEQIQSGVGADRDEVDEKGAKGAKGDAAASHTLRPRASG